MGKSKKRPQTSRAAREKKRAQERARRNSLRDCSLRADPPPFLVYEEWYSAKDLLDASNRRSMTDDERELAEMMISLGPLYGDLVPVAAISLEDMVRQGTIRMAVDGQPGMYRDMPVSDLTALFPQGTDASDRDELSSVVHLLHAGGFLVIDDDEVLHLAVPPAHSGGGWEIMGTPAPTILADTIAAGPV